MVREMMKDAKKSFRGKIRTQNYNIMSLWATKSFGLCKRDDYKPHKDLKRISIKFSKGLVSHLQVKFSKVDQTHNQLH